MIRLLGFGLLISCALIGLGSAIQCYTGKGTLTETSCPGEYDSCMKAVFKDGTSDHRCIKYTDCHYEAVANLYPTEESVSSSCCTKNLCNHAPSSAATSVIGLLAALFFSWWFMY